MRKIIFLDIDGVLNSHAWWQEREKLAPDCSREDFHRNEFDPKAVKMFNELVQATGAEVVLSSVWRLHEDNRQAVRDNGIEFSDVTGECTSRIRGAEILMWVRDNVPGYYKDYKLTYAIIDDDSDMLLWQKDSFFRTDTEVGLTPEICESIKQHFNC